MGQTEAVYSEGIFTLSTNVARQCAKLKVPRLVEISSGQMYSSDKVSTLYEGSDADVDGAKWRRKIRKYDAIFSNNVTQTYELIFFRFKFEKGMLRF